jgi:hypothetical protein
MGVLLLVASLIHQPDSRVSLFAPGLVQHSDNDEQKKQPIKKSFHDIASGPRTCAQDRSGEESA